MASISLTTWIALYAAALSTIVCAWTVYRDLIDKGRLRVRCSIRDIVDTDRTIHATNQLMYLVTNVGRRPVLVTHIGGRGKDKKFVLTETGLPKKLQPGDRFTFLIPVAQFPTKRLRCLWAGDSLGRTYKANRGIIRKLRGESQASQPE